MKVLRIYDHLGQLKKEFNVYVDGEDFKWQASVPEVMWLGSIVLEDAGKEPRKPPELILEEEKPEELTEEEELEQAPFLKGIEEDIGAIPVEKEEKSESKKRSKKGK